MTTRFYHGGPDNYCSGDSFDWVEIDGVHWVEIDGVRFSEHEDVRRFWDRFSAAFNAPPPEPPRRTIRVPDTLTAAQAAAVASARIKHAVSLGLGTVEGFRRLAAAWQSQVDDAIMRCTRVEYEQTAGWRYRTVHVTPPESALAAAEAARLVVDELDKVVRVLGSRATGKPAVLTARHVPRAELARRAADRAVEAMRQERVRFQAMALAGMLLAAPKERTSP